jgi:hypothetical protein
MDFTVRKSWTFILFGYSVKSIRLAPFFKKSFHFHHMMGWTSDDYARGVDFKALAKFQKKCNLMLCLPLLYFKPGHPILTGRWP